MPIRDHEEESQSTGSSQVESVIAGTRAAAEKRCRELAKQRGLTMQGVSWQAGNQWNCIMSSAKEVAISYPLQVSVHDWVKPSDGVMVWTKDQGHLCPELESPRDGSVTLYVDYRRDADETLIQADVELAIEASIGRFPAGPRWIGRSSLDADTVVSVVCVIPLDLLGMPIEAIEAIVPGKFLASFDGKKHYLM